MRATPARCRRTSWTSIAELEDRWETDLGEALAKSGDPGLDDVFAALYYLELETQDVKLGGPLEQAEPAETPVAGGSQDWVEANLRGFRLLFTGGEGTGMDDLLVEAGHPETTDGVLAALDAADAAAAALTVPIDAAAATDPAPAQAVLDAVKEVTSLLEGDVRRILLLQIPSEAAGDND